MHMTIRAAILSGVAALALSSVNAIAQDDYSRYGGGPPGSSLSEKEQTQQLNAQAITGTPTSPATLNGEATSDYPGGDEYNVRPSGESNAYQQGYSDQAQYGGPPPEEYQQGSPYAGQAQYGGPPPEENAPIGDEAGPPSGPQAQYEEQQQQYQQQLQNYGNQQQRYQYERQRYARNIRDYDLAQYAWNYPAPVEYRYGDESGLQPLYLMAEPSEQLARVPVAGPGGRWVGRVRNVEIAPDGRPSRVEVALNRRVSVWVRPGDLRFDPSKGVLYTDLTRDDLWDMPGATIESGPL
jgi:hypothetical protein